MQRYFILIALLLGGCMIDESLYTPPSAYNFPSSRVYEKPFTGVWASLIEWFALSGTPIRILDKQSGFVATDYALPMQYSEYCDCGTGGMSFASTIRVSDIDGNFNVLVQQVSDSTTKVTVTARYSALLIMEKLTPMVQEQLKGYRRLQCASKGRIEWEIMDYIQSH